MLQDAMQKTQKTSRIIKFRLNIGIQFNLLLIEFYQIWTNIKFQHIGAEIVAIIQNKVKEVSYTSTYKKTLP